MITYVSTATVTQTWADGPYQAISSNVALLCGGCGEHTLWLVTALLTRHLLCPGCPADDWEGEA